VDGEKGCKKEEEKNWASQHRDSYFVGSGNRPSGVEGLDRITKKELLNLNFG